MKTLEAIEKVRHFANSDICVSARWFARQANVSEWATRNINDPDWNPQARTLQALESVVEDHQGYQA